MRKTRENDMNTIKERIVAIKQGFGAMSIDQETKLTELLSIPKNSLVFTSRSAAKKLTGMSYLAGLNSSAKTEKGTKYDIDTLILYMLPYKMSGLFNTCNMASKECAAACLNTSGRVKMDKANHILFSRLQKTILFYEQRLFFVDWLKAEIAAESAKSREANRIFAVRLNGTTDLSPLMFIGSDKTNILASFPEVNFYDYTKQHRRFEMTQKYPNYTLTFSDTGHNRSRSMELISQGYNVAIVFADTLPETYQGYEVINGDLSDYRIGDPSGVFVGLKFKVTRSFQSMDTDQRSEFLSDNPFINVA